MSISTGFTSAACGFTDDIVYDLIPLVAEQSGHSLEADESNPFAENIETVGERGGAMT
jgi:hypothetical protein